MSYTVDSNFTQHTNNVVCLTILNDGRVATGSQDNRVKIWNPDTKTVDTNFTKHNTVVQDIDTLDDGRIVSSDFNGVIKVWNPDTKTVDTNFTKHNDDVHQIDIIDTDGYIASISTDGILKIWNPQTGSVDLSKNLGFGFGLTVTALDDGRVAAGNSGGDIYIIDRNGNIDIKFQNGHNNRIGDITQLDDGRVVSGDRDNLIFVWNLSDKSIDTNFTEHTSFITSVEITKDGRVISGSPDQTAKIWNPDTKIVDVNFTEHTSTVRDTGNLDDGRIVSCSEDETAKVWDTGIQVKDASLSMDYVANVSTDSAQFSGSLDSTTQISDADLGFITRKTSNNNVVDEHYAFTFNPNNKTLPFGFLIGRSNIFSSGTEYKTNAILRDGDGNKYESSNSLTFTTEVDVSIITEEPEDPDDDGAILKATVENVKYSIEKMDIYANVRKQGNQNIDAQIQLGSVDFTVDDTPITIEKRVDSLDPSTDYEYQAGAVVTQTR